MPDDVRERSAPVPGFFPQSAGKKMLTLIQILVRQSPEEFLAGLGRSELPVE